MERIKEVIGKENEKGGVIINAELPGSGVAPLFVDPEENKFFISSLQEAFQKVTGLEPKLEAIGGTTFAKAFPNSVSFGPILFDAGEKEIAHQTDERVTVSHLLRNARIYAYAIALLCIDLD
jgi:acetylornithine deacetylase/succinyl-diaminopimelate desuccinylase-like protein